MATALLNRNFTLFWSGQFLSNIGSNLSAVAVTLWITQETGSASLVGFLMMCVGIPTVLLAPLGGAVADRKNRLRIIILCDVLCGAVLLSLSAVMMQWSASSTAIFWWMTLVCIALGTLNAFFGPAGAALLPDLVPPSRLEGANAVSSTTIEVSSFVGQGIGGLMYQWLGGPLVFLIDGLSYGLSAVSTSFIRMPSPRGASRTPAPAALREYLGDIREGLRYVWRQPGLRAMFLSAAVLNLFLEPFVVLLPFYVHTVLGHDAAWYGYLMASFSVGLLLGYLIAGTLHLSPSRRAVLVMTLLVAEGGALIGLGCVHHVAGALAACATIGALEGIINTYYSTIIQLGTPPEMRGRVMGLLTTLFGGLSPFGMLAIGIVADAMGQNIPLIYILCGTINLCIAILLPFSRSFRMFLAIA